jgi:hypothetical protein
VAVDRQEATSGWMPCGTIWTRRPSRYSEKQMPNEAMNATIELRVNAEHITPIET